MIFPLVKETLMYLDDDCWSFTEYLMSVYNQKQIHRTDHSS